MIAYLVFLFFVIVVLLNVLIAQMSKTYEDTAEGVNTKYYQALARHLNRYRQDLGELPYRQYLLIGRLYYMYNIHDSAILIEPFMFT